MVCKHLKGKVCRLELFGGVPKPSDCASCSSYEGKIRGAGDVVAKVAKVTGIEKAVQAITKGECNCGKRRASLNKQFPIGGTDATGNDRQE